MATVTISCPYSITTSPITITGTSDVGTSMRLEIVDSLNATTVVSTIPLSNGAYSYIWDTSTIPAGFVTLKMYARESSVSIAYQEKVVFKPSGVLTNPTILTPIGDNNTVSQDTKSSVVFTGTAPPFSNLYFSVGTISKVISTPSSGIWSTTENLNSFPNGSYTLNVYAYQGSLVSDNIAAPFVIANTPDKPTVVVSSQIGDLASIQGKTSSNATVYITVKDAQNQTINTNTTSNSYGNYSLSIDTSLLADGSVTFTVYSVKDSVSSSATTYRSTKVDIAANSTIAIEKPTLGDCGWSIGHTISIPGVAIYPLNPEDIVGSKEDSGATIKTKVGKAIEEFKGTRHIFTVTLYALKASDFVKIESFCRQDKYKAIRDGAGSVDLVKDGKAFSGCFIDTVSASELSFYNTDLEEILDKVTLIVKHTQYSLI